MSEQIAGMGQNPAWTCGGRCPRAWAELARLPLGEPAHELAQPPYIAPARAPPQLDLSFDDDWAD